MYSCIYFCSCQKSIPCQKSIRHKCCDLPRPSLVDCTTRFCIYPLSFNLFKWLRLTSTKIFSKTQCHSHLKPACKHPELFYKLLSAPTYWHTSLCFTEHGIHQHKPTYWTISIVSLSTCPHDSFDYGYRKSRSTTKKESKKRPLTIGFSFRSLFTDILIIGVINTSSSCRRAGKKWFGSLLKGPCILSSCREWVWFPCESRRRGMSIVSWKHKV